MHVPLALEALHKPLLLALTCETHYCSFITVTVDRRLVAKAVLVEDAWEIVRKLDVVDLKLIVHVLGDLSLKSDIGSSNWLHLSWDGFNLISSLCWLGVWRLLNSNNLVVDFNDLIRLLLSWLRSLCRLH